MANKIKCSQLRGANACYKKRQKFSKVEVEDEKGNRYQKSAIAKEVIKKVLIYREFSSEEQIKTFIEKKMSELEYLNEVSRKRDTEEMIFNVSRYLRYEKRIPEKPIKETVKINGYDLDVAPDLIFRGEKKDKNGNIHPYIEVAIIKTGKPVLSKKGRSQETNIEKNIEINAALELARTYLGNQVGLVGAGIYYLRSDKNDTPDFSEVEQKAYLEDVNVPGTGDSIRRLELERELKMFMDGNKCTKTMCSKCSFSSICGFVQSPVKVKEPPKEFNINNIHLSESQASAVNVRKGIYRVNAGAGCGKTLVVSLRVARMLAEGIEPESIILTTFTNAGVDEMRTRIEFLLKAYGIDINIDSLKIVTLNEFGNELISMYYKELGYSSVPTVADIIEKVDILLPLINDLDIEGLDYKNLFMNLGSAKGAVPYLLSQFDVIKQKMYSSADEYIRKENIAEEMMDASEKIWNVYNDFQKMMKEKNLIEYADQDMAVFKVLSIEPDLFDLKFKFKHIIVDEFQDCSETQIQLIREMCSSNHFESLMCVGDDAQAIYGFRNTSPKYMLHLENYLGENVNDIYIVENRRSTPEIVSLANYVNELNRDKIDKKLVAVNTNGPVPVLYEAKNQKEEYKKIASGIKSKIEEGIAPTDICVIASKKSELLNIQNELTKEGVPSQMAVPEKAVSNSRVDAILNLAGYILNNEATTLLMTYLNALFNGEIMEKDVNRQIKTNKEFFENYYYNLSNEQQLTYIFNLFDVLDDGNDDIYSSFLRMLKEKNFATAGNLCTYMVKYLMYGTDVEFRIDGKYNAVTLTTAHSSKGKEWDVVYATISEFDTKIEKKFEDYEETRRLLFVTITRARKELNLSGTYYIGSPDDPMRRTNKFMQELTNAPSNHIRKVI